MPDAHISKGATEGSVIPNPYRHHLPGGGRVGRLWLSGNELTGEIPEELGNLNNLVEWRLADNDLTGCLPVGLATVEDNDLDQLGLEVCGDG